MSLVTRGAPRLTLRLLDISELSSENRCVDILLSVRRLI